jgi:hypothetical protein
MQDLNVLVIFHSRTGRTEKLALASAVGAVQARANIRLRWTREAVDDETIASVPEWKENRERMAKEYIAPREIDVEWADAVIVGTSGELPELKGNYRGKVGTAFCTGSSGDGPLYGALAELGLIVVPCASDADGLESARVRGRRVTEVARAIKLHARPLHAGLF